MASGDVVYIGTEATSQGILELINHATTGINTKENTILQNIISGLTLELKPPIALYSGMSTSAVTINGQGKLFIQADTTLASVQIDGVSLPTGTLRDGSIPVLEFTFNTSVYIPRLITGENNNRGTYVVLLY